MWTARSEELADGRGIRNALYLDASPAPYREVLRRWRFDSDFRSWFIAILASAPFTAFRWETPSIAIGTVDRPFEFVLLDSPGLAGKPDPDAFAEYCSRPEADRGVVEFPNLDKDAILVVPCPNASPWAYGHLAAFLRLAPERQRHVLWEAVSEAVERRLGAAPVWVSTAGAGVSWLHVRIDDRPKYYGFAPYRSTA